MARTGLDKSEVKRACELLESQGRYPSADAVRVVLGNTGSKTTIHKYLKELEQEAGKVTDSQRKTAKSLQEFVDDMAAKLHSDADERIEQVLREHALALQQKDVELAQLQKKVASLSYQLEQLEEVAGSGAWAHDLQRVEQEKSNKRSGFGIFGLLTNNERSSKPGWSRFNNLFGTRASEPVNSELFESGNLSGLPV